jgi:hypothetical protein
MKKFGRAGSTFGTVVAGAVVIAIASTGGAVAGGLITSKQIKNNTIKSVDVRDGNLKGVDVADGSLTGADLADGSVTTGDVANGSLTHGDFTSSPIGVAQGYAWNNISAPGAAPVALTNGYTYNSAGGPVTVSSSAAGVYLVTFSGLNFDPGNVQVSGYGGGSTWCKVGSWASGSVSVLCFNDAGAATNSLFSVAVIK